MFRKFNVNLKDDNHNIDSAGKSSLGGEFGGIRSDPPNLVGEESTLDLTDDEPAMGLSSMAMVVTLEHMEVDGVSLASVFNKDLFQSQEARARFSRTQVANDDQATVATESTSP